MEPDLTVSRDIAASPEAVFAAITDVTRMGEWSPENHTNEWKEGITEAAVGARWVGHNRNGDKEWSTESRVTEMVHNERFTFECVAPAYNDFHFATWRYDIEATDTGCRVTESWQDLRPDEMRQGISPTSGVGDRVPHNRDGMERTLAALAAAVEG
ncbi:MAG: SRPBCC family protein [Actinomycetota bacterium]